MKKPSNTSTHESAHSLVAYIIGPTPTYIYSNPDRFQGYVEFDQRFKLVPKDWATIYMAGSIAEELWYLGENGGPNKKNQISIHDLIEINKLGLSFDQLSSARKETIKMLKEAKKDIFKIARFLDEYETIHTAKEFKMILLEDLDI